MSIVSEQVDTQTHTVTRILISESSKSLNNALLPFTSWKEIRLSNYYITSLLDGTIPSNKLSHQQIYHDNCSCYFLKKSQTSYNMNRSELFYNTRTHADIKCIQHVWQKH